LRQIPPQAFYTEKFIKCSPDICHNVLVFATAPAPKRAEEFAKPNKRKMANAICSFVARPPPCKRQLNRNDKYNRSNNKNFYQPFIWYYFCFSFQKIEYFCTDKIY
jgi:hypothetical protein